MAKYALAIYKTAAAAEAALEAVDNTTTAVIVPFMEQGRQKFALITGGPTEIGSLTSIVTAVEKIDDIQDACKAEAGTATKGIMLLADNGTNGTFVQMWPTSLALKASAARGSAAITIAQDASLSSAWAMEGHVALALVLPAALEAGASVITFQGSNALAGTYQNICDGNGLEVSVTLPATYTSINLSLDTVLEKLAPFPFLKMRFGIAALPVVQTAARAITVLMV
jgi:hypothetical protein